MTNALELHVFQSRQGGQEPRITAELAAAAQACFEDDLREQSFLERVAAQVSAIAREAGELSLRHTARHGFRSYDLIHVAQARVLDCEVFWSFDRKANHLARLEGLATIGGERV